MVEEENNKHIGLPLIHTMEFTIETLLNCLTLSNYF
jgi:hypothetical protein